MTNNLGVAQATRALWGRCDDHGFRFANCGGLVVQVTAQPSDRRVPASLDGRAPRRRYFR